MLYINGNNLSFADYFHTVYEYEKVNVAPEVENRIKEAYALVDRIVKSKRVVYGISTGFGKLVDVRIQEKDIDALQTNLILSHACGVGKPLLKEFVRGAMLLRLNVIAKGNSGVRLETFNLLKDLLNRDIIPVVPEKGSVGA
ncbi:MAG: aromatic amino acid lyase, partial [Proteobacteria bacterium]|nr:aromatic amino acid lyase [Pseudomonadota bacterium]